MASNKNYFVGISLNTSNLTETGLAVLDRDLNIIRIDKFYSVSDLDAYIQHNFTKTDTIISIDLPENQTQVDGKWRYETKKILPLSLSPHHKTGYKWTERHSERGSDNCKSLIEQGYEIHRYLGSSIKNSLGITAPFRDRTPQFAKYFQIALEHKFGIKGFSTNLMSLAALDALVGAYLSYQIWQGKQKVLGKFNEFDIVGLG